MKIVYVIQNIETHKYFTRDYYHNHFSAEINNAYKYDSIEDAEKDFKDEYWNEHAFNELMYLEIKKYYIITEDD